MLTFTAEKDPPLRKVDELPPGTLFSIKHLWPLYLRTETTCVRVGAKPGTGSCYTTGCSPGYAVARGLLSRFVEDTFGRLWITDKETP